MAEIGEWRIQTTNAALDAPKLDSIRFRLAYGALEPVLWESPKIGKLLINFNEIDGKWRRAAALYREALHSRWLNTGPETRPATMFYSVKRTPTSILEPLRRVNTSKRSSPSLCFGDEQCFGDRAFSNTKRPLPSSRTGTCHVDCSQPRSLTSPASLAPKGQSGNHNCNNHTSRHISSAEFH